MINDSNHKKTTSPAKLYGYENRKRHIECQEKTTTTSKNGINRKRQQHENLERHEETTATRRRRHQINDK